MSAGAEALLRAIYAAFNERDIAAILPRLSEDVDWPNGMEGGRVHGRAAVEAYWTRQFSLIDSRVEPVAVTPLSDGRVRVTARQIVRGPDGAIGSERIVGHVYTLVDGAVAHMDIEDG